MANPLSRLGSFISANRPFFLLVLLIILSVSGYFWWQSGFTLDFSRFFAYGECDDGDACTADSCSGGYDPDTGDCLMCEHTSIDECPPGPVCGDASCDGGETSSSCRQDCADSCGAIYGAPPAAFCTQSSSCPSGYGNGVPSSDCVKCCQQNEQPVYTCTQTAGQFCYTGGGGCPSPNVSGSGSCASGICCRSAAAPVDVPCSDGAATCKSSCNTSTEDNVGACVSGGNPSVCCKPKSTDGGGGGGSDGCTGLPLIDQKGTTKSCLVSESFASDRCTIAGQGQTLTRKVRIINNQPAGSHDLYSRVAIFYTPTQTCGAHASNPGSAGGFLDIKTVRPGETKDVTYTFTVPDDCGSWQLDDQWGPDGLDAIGKVINTGVTCTTPHTSGVL